MKNFSQSELEAAHRIYNHVDSLVGYYGRKTLDDVVPFLSENRWIMFPIAGVDSLREGADAPVFNIYVSMDGKDFSDDANGRPTGYVGLTYHNKPAMFGLRGILKRKVSKGSVLLKALKTLSDEWGALAVHKIKTDCKESVPRYVTVSRQKPSETTIESIIQALSDSDRKLPSRDDLFENANPILWAVTIFSVEKATGPGSFDADVKSIFDVFKKLHALQ